MADKFTIREVFKDNEQIVMTESVCIPNCLDYHKHEYIEIAYIHSGTGYHILNGEKNFVKKGDIFMLSKNSMHNYEAITEDFKWYNALIRPELFNKQLIDINTAYDFLKISVFAEFRSYNIASDDIVLYHGESEFDNVFEQMMEEYRKKDVCYQEMLKSLLTILIIKMFRAFIKESRKERKKESMSDIVIEHLKEHFDEKLDIIKIAQRAFVSPEYFSTLFKKKTGTTLTQFYQEYRIKRACELFDTTDASVVAVMHEVGYNDSKCFYKTFKKFTGLTPGEYRKQRHGNA